MTELKPQFFLPGQRKLTKLMYRWFCFNRFPGLKYCNSLPGHLNLFEAMFLFKEARKAREGGTIVEIGSYLGKSTCFLAEGIGNRKIDFHAIDTFENQGMSEGLKDTLGEFKKNVKPYIDKIQIHQGYSYDVVNEFQGKKIDLLWVDACHLYEACKKDIEDWVPLVADDGLICFHDYDYYNDEIRVKKAVNEAIAAGKLKPVEMVGPRMVVLKKGTVFHKKETKHE